MTTTDPRIDAYFARQAEFAKPILVELRQRLHAACPDLEESIKWGAPAFLYKGKLLAVVAAFKQHAAFNLWHGKQVLGDGAQAADAMGQYGRLATLKDLPAKRETARHIKAAMQLIESGASTRPPRAPKPPPDVPDDLAGALRGHRAARATWEEFAPGKRRDYVEWITEAKRPETRAKRVAQAMEWLAEGKSRNWKYERR